jgi:two-component system, OmpR family, sensor kinase
MTNSLRAQLTFALCALVAVVAIVQGLSSYQLSKAGMSALLDLRLEQVANRMRGDLGDLLPAIAARGSQPERDVVVTIWKGDSDEPFRSTEPSLRLPRNSPEGFETVVIDSEPWRVYTLRDQDRVIEVAQRSTVRRELAEHNAVRTLWPMVVLIPLVWVAVLLVVNWSLRQLKVLGREVRNVDVNSLQALSLSGVPAEIRPFIDSINSMMARLARSIDGERAFISDAAHELRTPLTALQIQASNLARDIVPGNQERFRELREGIARSARMVEQLLGLARADVALRAESVVSVDLAAVVVAAIAEVLPIAASRNIDIGAVELKNLHVQAAESDVGVALRNLVSNAIRYTPDGGQVDLHVVECDGKARIEVVDTGPGISEALLPRVFDRFFRANTLVEGTGLGLSIVKAIAVRYGGSVALRNRDDGASGIVATLAFPLSA